MEAEERQSRTGDNWSNGIYKEEPHGDFENGPQEYHHKLTTIGSSPGFGNHPEESPQNKTLRTTKLNCLVHEP